MAFTRLRAIACFLAVTAVTKYVATGLDRLSATPA
jgi:hypothetical protein